MSEPVRGLIIGHSTLAAGFAAAVTQIAGAEPGTLVAVSNEGRGPEGLMDAVRTAAGNAPALLLTDLPSGSCALAARKIAMSRPDTAFVCGVNLPLLLDFVFHRDLPLPELVARLVEKGRCGIIGSPNQDSGNAHCAATVG